MLKHYANTDESICNAVMRAEDKQICAAYTVIITNYVHKRPMHTIQ